MPKKKLNYHDLSNKVQSMVKTRHENDMTNCTCAIYGEIKTKFSWLIGQDVVYHEK